MTSGKDSFYVQSPNVEYTEDCIYSRFNYQTSKVEEKADGSLIVKPSDTTYYFRTKRHVPKLGVMLVGWGGNNGSTITASVIANKLGIIWNTKNGPKKANYFGSITQSSTVCLGTGTNGDVHVPLKNLLPMVDPNDVVFDGWDISSASIADAMERAEVLDINLQKQVRPYLEGMHPRPSVYFPDFIAANQLQRADNVLTGSHWDQMNAIRSDIRDFRNKNNLEKVIVLWTANTERFSDVSIGLNDTADNLLQSIKRSESEISPSTLFAVASILEECCFLNGSPQNTLVPGVVDLACQKKVFIGGDDFKSGQTKIKSVLVDFLVNAGIKPTAIVSYNHLGNNDGKNLSAPKQFKSKEISKSSVVDDMVASNQILYKNGEKPDHTIVIKYVPYVKDSKRALDEYTSEIFMGGHNTLVIHNTCEDSLLASPIILDLVILAEVCQRISLKTETSAEYESFHSVLSILSYLLKAPAVPPGTPVVNALFKQRACIENIFRACVGLAPQNHMSLEYKRACVPDRNVLLAEYPWLIQNDQNGVHEHQQKVTKTVSNGHFDIRNGIEAVNGTTNGHHHNGMNGNHLDR